MRLFLQNRWKQNGNRLFYYGLRHEPYTFQKSVRLRKRELPLIEKAVRGAAFTEKESRAARRLIRVGALVLPEAYKKTPASFEEAAFCKTCCANDYMIPGLELNEDGMCPVCTHYHTLAKHPNVIPVLSSIPESKNADYDAAVFYTGGKDSSFLLYYLSRVLKLRVLALTWELPYLSENARRSIKRAKECLPEVTFLMKKAPDSALAKIYRKSYALQENTCICPSVAYVLFFETLATHRIPYLILGNEPAQCGNLVLNRMAPRFYFHPAAQTAARLFFNAGRILTLKKPLKRGQAEFYTTVRGLAFGRPEILKRLDYENVLVDNTATALNEAPELMEPFRVQIRQAGKNGSLPALVHLDLNCLAGGIYRWNHVKEVLKNEIGWEEPLESAKGLHTSCQIECCKEYSQFSRFRRMESDMIPFSALELPLAVCGGSIGREAAIRELCAHTGFLNEEPPEGEIMRAAFTEK